MFYSDINTSNSEIQPQYIVATTASFSVRLTLSEAIVISLLELDYRVAIELQTFSRYNQLGNKNLETLLQLFYAKGNAQEEGICTRNQVRKKIAKEVHKNEKENKQDVELGVKYEEILVDDNSNEAQVIINFSN